MQRVLVTGAAGFIGGHLVEALKKEGYKVRAVDLRKDKWGILDDKEIEFVKADLTKKIDPSLLKDIDIIFHCAALFDFAASKEDSFKFNVDMVENLCDAILKSKVRRVIHWSTAAGYGNTDDIEKADEETKCLHCDRIGNFMKEE